ncbi:hypothetical protein IV203_019805 [Nitzschia inconspicua]|uniref:Uncharacterized protein n=1 Tax=Nitzschia inconspicua TaxID=303405 RepID=A0A9K3M0K1_9STRA|nr:hypothetical protein IV203_019805 [Nitzschia inconspicua]
MHDPFERFLESMFRGLQTNVTDYADMATEGFEKGTVPPTSSKRSKSSEDLDEQFPTGSLVQIAGLESGMDRNGHRGDILFRTHDTRRVTVKLTVKPENVEVLWTYDENECKTVFHECDSKKHDWSISRRPFYCL